MSPSKTKSYQINLTKYLRKVVLFSMLLSHGLFAQTSLQKKADQLFDRFAFADAANAYKKLVNKNYNAEYNTRQIADCYAFMRNPDSAVIYYEKVMDQKNFPIAYYYNYAQALRGVKKNSKYRKYMRRFEKAGGFIDNDALEKDKTFLDAVLNAKQQYILMPVGFNSKYSEFGAVENNGKIYFASSRDQGVVIKNTYGWNNEPFLDIYEANSISDMEIDHKNKVPGDVNTRFHEGTLSVTKDGKTMYFSRNDFTKQVLGKDDRGVTNLKIYKAELVDGKWTNIQELPFNSSKFSTSHPALNEDETKLYFASDRPGSYGGSDIFYVTIYNDGTYGKPVNAGPVVNTSKNEKFPFINNEGVLFFASDGHPGLGLLDIFGTVVNKSKKIVDVFNLGMPVNSSKDDFSFFMNPDGLTGYFASNRNGGMGDDDIYAYKRIPALKLEGLVTDDQGIPLANAKIEIFDEKNKSIAQVLTDETGNYAINIDRNTDYKVSALKEGYVDALKFVSSRTVMDSETLLTTDFTLEKEKTELPFTELYPIYFDFNKYDIRKESTTELDRIVNLLTEVYPSMVIRIESHTDSRGRSRYNIKLSEERAKATYDYLIQHGVSADRIESYKGFGETRLVNDCDGSKPCTEAQHQMNRRTQFIIIKME